MSDGYITGEHKRAVADRAKGCCEYCWSQALFSPDPFSVEHIVPRSRGGTPELSNLALSCQGCNNRKYTSMEALDRVTGEAMSLYHPRLHTWSDHFTWNHNYLLILGLSPTGRATIEKLQLNRIGVINLRRILRAFGEHPPR
jgi:HNH endonuclease